MKRLVTVIESGGQQNQWIQACAGIHSCQHPELHHIFCYTVGTLMEHEPLSIGFLASDRVTEDLVYLGVEVLEGGTQV